MLRYFSISNSGRESRTNKRDIIVKVLTTGRKAKHEKVLEAKGRKVFQR